MSIPRTTHPWLKPFYDMMEGKGTRQPQIGSSTGTIGMYGVTGIAPRLATGGLNLSATFLGASGFASTGIGASGLYTHLARFAAHGGTGTPYTLDDLVRSLKNLTIIPQ